ncbi:MAG: cyclic beta 1-2 glucan synthetase [Desulfamplus sp.]|nr:cyclic beta 1-2 glucan synthetase [Desulfamplus sp.]
MLRLALIENLRRIAARLAADKINRNLAELWADKMIGSMAEDPNGLIMVIADMVRSNPPMVGPFVAELTRRLQGEGPALALPLTCIEQRLAGSGLTIEHLVRLETRQQAADQVSVSNSIGSLRFLSAMDWHEFVETMSVVDKHLSNDPADVYGRMDFSTRDAYRHVIERLAGQSSMSEGEVAKQAIELAEAAAAEKGVDDRRAHVGFYLIDKGLPKLEQLVALHFSPGRILGRIIQWFPGSIFSGFPGRVISGFPGRIILRFPGRILRRFPLPVYTGSIVFLTFVMAACFFAKAHADGLGKWAFWPVALLLLLCLFQPAVSLVNGLATFMVRPRPLPRMDFSTGIPSELRSLVVVPTLLTSIHAIDDLMEAMEVRFLANRDIHLHFGLLTDFYDAAKEHLPEDESLLLQARLGVEALNRKYRIAQGDIFFLFHRPRLWNPQEKIWMGYERKRGKIADLNRLLRGGSDERFSLVVGDTIILSSVKYVITLDTDTLLARDSARQFVGAMAHPLNRPVYDEKRQRVIEGYGILQPRVAISLSGTNPSFYARLCGSEPGIDPYTRVVSDVYQDLFGQGSFIGKGIYDVDAFQKSLDGRFPENLILSHDLLEGSYAGAGLISDVELYEEYPSSYTADVDRRHRWIRGDWQIARWLFPGVPGPDGHIRKNPLSMLSRWKIFDNLRRSLVAPSLTLLLLLGWLVFASPRFWTLAVIGIILLPFLPIVLLNVFQKPVDVRLGEHLTAILKSARQNFLQGLLTLVCLPHEAFYSLNAMVRTIWRMVVTRKQLLEWNPSDRAGGHNQQDKSGIGKFFISMAPAPVIAVASAMALVLLKPASLTAAGPLLIMWAFSPAITWWISRQPLTRSPESLTGEQTRFLHGLSRKTWAFFETFMGPEDNWLPPDNYQEVPVGVIAHRTSPTNIGLALLTNLAAYDFGYICGGKLIRRTSDTLNTMSNLERYQGHFYNWYDTLSLEPLLPRYISSVDSGNLAGHLLTLRPGLYGIIEDTITGRRLFQGLSSTFQVLFDLTFDLTKEKFPERFTEIQREKFQERFTEIQREKFQERLTEIQKMLEKATHAPPATLTGMRLSLDRLLQSAQALEREISAMESGHQTPLLESGRQTPLLESGRETTLLESGRQTPFLESGRQTPLLESDRETTLLEGHPETPPEWWSHAFAGECRNALDELMLLAPWTDHLSSLDKPGEMPDIDTIPTLDHVARMDAGILPEIDHRLSLAVKEEEKVWLVELARLISLAGQEARKRIVDIENLCIQVSEFAEMKYDFLFDLSRRLLSIGYNVSDHRRDSGYYDLLASEARFAGFVAIAQGKLPQESWFALGRPLTSTGEGPVLLSWSGSMFEYLMPLLVMPAYENTLLYQTCKSAVASQIAYGKKCAVPWGVSECGYNAIDVHHNYQYRAFGVPGLGLKRGLAEDLVIAPYASVMALMIAPKMACLNLERMTREGFSGKYGFYEAVDYTQSRLPPGRDNAVVRSFMAHHQGMSFLSLSSVLLDRPMQKRFESEPLFQSALLLLQERIPRATSLYILKNELADHHKAVGMVEKPIRCFSRPDTPTPEIQLLSNGRYHVMVTAAGGGYSRWKDLAVTRWREDSTSDNYGFFCYIRDIKTQKYWSTTHQPTLTPAKKFNVVFSEGRAEFRCEHDELEAYTEVVVSPEDDIELRRITLTNRARRKRTIDVTGYAEVVLAPPMADALHPAFSNLFVETEIIPEQQAILCTRRPRSREEVPPFMLHLMAIHGVKVKHISFETDRMKFIGRGNSVANPRAMTETADPLGQLSGTQGAVLDPIVAIRCRLELDPGESIVINMVTGMGETRDKAMRLIEKYQDRHLAQRVFELAWTHGQVFLKQINATETDAQLYARLANTVVYANSALRADAAILKKNRSSQSSLWGYGISGDLPIVLFRIEDMDNIDLVRQIMQAHLYWRLKGLIVDLVIWNEGHTGYRQLLHDQIVRLIAAGIETNVIDRPGGIFIRSADQITEEDRILFQTVARVIISDGRGTLSDQINDGPSTGVTMPQLNPGRRHRPNPPATLPLPRRDLIFYNGLGGFTRDGREYVITTAEGQNTPAPWVNVLANPLFGAIVNESGPGCTWSENAHEFRLTPWENDPVTHASGEAFYIRDEERGHFWSPTPAPCPGSTPYVTRHGFGYTVFEHTERGIKSELWIYVAIDAPVKFSVLKVRNISEYPRKLSATGYVEWVLGDLRQKSGMHVVTSIDAMRGVLFAENAYSIEFPNRTAFFDVNDINCTITGDRTEFLGRNHTLSSPAAMRRTRLSGRVGAALDPCAAIQVGFHLAAGEEREIIFRLGSGKDKSDAEDLVHRLRGSEAARNVLDTIWQYWTQTLGAVNVETPDPSLNVLANGWLLYQTLACRLWARNATYQSGGAFGFRDQLQDVMALIYARPHLVREHLLLAASRQFEEGDVQHWWHPPLGRGVRTLCSDDYLWLPLAISRYLLVTGDTGVLDEEVSFLSGRNLDADEESYYDLPGRSQKKAGLYDHCVRAIQKSLTFGEHGLPLIGSCDWNDGMNLVGKEGRGESVWLGFFLYEVLLGFAGVADKRKDTDFAHLCRSEATTLKNNIESHGWDGDWYRRAYFDDGTPLGSSINQECRIDSISQSWSVLSGAGSRERSILAMESLDKHLVSREYGLVRLLYPPFDKSELNPGYIKGYVPGVRENGGQYTHAAIWAAMAFARLGDNRRAWELFTLINPVNHARSPSEVDIYKVEPYVVAADVYAVAPHMGRGGWTWYTGSSAWMYRLIIESILGLTLEVDKLRLTPCIPKEWKGFKLHYRYRETLYHISVLQQPGEQEQDQQKPDEQKPVGQTTVGQITGSQTTVGQITGGKVSMKLLVDGNAQKDNIIHLCDDHKEHWVDVRIFS